MGYKVPFVNPARNYQMIKDEIDAAYFEVMSKGDLINRLFAVKILYQVFENKDIFLHGSSREIGNRGAPACIREKYRLQREVPSLNCLRKR